MFVLVFSDEKDLLSTSLYTSFQASASSSLYGTLIVLSKRLVNILSVCVKLAIACYTDRLVQQQQASLLSFVNFFTRKSVGVIVPFMLQ